jgi:hypothetical protein
LGNEHAAIVGGVGLAGQPPPVLQFPSGDEELVLRCGRGSTLQEADPALSARPPAAALGVDRQARLSYCIKKGNPRSGLDLQAESLQGDHDALRGFGLNHHESRTFPSHVLLAWVGSSDAVMESIIKGLPWCGKSSLV